jgi:hypothetical protein
MQDILNDGSFEGWADISICVTNDHGYVFPFVTITIQSFPYSRLITGCATRVTPQVPVMEQ